MDVNQLIQKHEGLRLKPYKCPAGKITIGYGRNLEDKGITEQEAEQLLQNDVASIKKSLRRNLSFFDDLSSARQAVLVDMAFNLGVGGLLKFQKTLSYVESGEYEQAAMEMLTSRWADQVGLRAITLSNMMFFGTWEQ